MIIIIKKKKIKAGFINNNNLIIVFKITNLSNISINNKNKLFNKYD